VIGRNAQPDGLLRTTAVKFRGADVYNTTGQEQTVSSRQQRGETATLQWRVQNDGTSLDRFTLQGSGSSQSFKVRYFVQGTECTRGIASGSFDRRLAPGTSVTVRVTIKVLPAASLDSVKKALLTARSQKMATQDTVMAKVPVTR
jgi:uncharacterized membrane protein